MRTFVLIAFCTSFWSSAVFAKNCTSVVTSILKHNGAGTFDKPGPKIDKIPTPAFKSTDRESILFNRVFKGTNDVDSITYFKPKSATKAPEVLLVEVSRSKKGECWLRRVERVFVDSSRCSVTKVEQEEFSNCEDEHLRTFGEKSIGVRTITRKECGSAELKDLCDNYFRLGAIAKEELEDMQIQIEDVKISPTVTAPPVPK